jgi:hypothetical protein
MLLVVRLDKAPCRRGEVSRESLDPNDFAAVAESVLQSLRVVLVSRTRGGRSLPSTWPGEVAPPHPVAYQPPVLQSAPRACGALSLPIRVASPHSSRIQSGRWRRAITLSRRQPSKRVGLTTNWDKRGSPKMIRSSLGPRPAYAAPRWSSWSGRRRMRCGRRPLRPALYEICSFAQEAGKVWEQVLVPEGVE